MKTSAPNPEVFFVFSHLFTFGRYSYRISLFCNRQNGVHAADSRQLTCSIWSIFRVIFNAPLLFLRKTMFELSEQKKKLRASSVTRNFFRSKWIRSLDKCPFSSCLSILLVFYSQSIKWYVEYCAFFSFFFFETTTKKCFLLLRCWLRKHDPGAKIWNMELMHFVVRWKSLIAWVEQHAIDFN